MAGRTDIHRSLNVMIEANPALTLFKCVMFKDGYFQEWDTSSVLNSKSFQGIVFNKGREFDLLAQRGVFFAEGLPDGTYYCDANGNLVNSLPIGSFGHEVGVQKSNYFRINDLLVSASVGSVSWGDIGGDINNQSDLISLFDVNAFISC